MRAVTTPVFQGPGPTDVEVIDWQTGKTVWRVPGDSATSGGGTVFAMAQPNGPKIGIAVATQAQSGDVNQLWLVAADGQATEAVNEVFYPAFYSGF
jgi:hypothetical protein